MLFFYNKRRLYVNSNCLNFQNKFVLYLFYLYISRGWRKNNDVQTCRGTLAVYKQQHQTGHLISTARIMGAPSSQTTKLAYRLRVSISCKKRRKPFPHFYFIQCKADKELDRSRAKNYFKVFSGKDYGTHGLNQIHKQQYSFRLNFSTIKIS